MTYRLVHSPRDWQKSALKSWKLEGRRGIVEVATGGGKTIFAEQCFLDSLNKWPHLGMVVLVPTLSLADQWYVSLQDELGVCKDEISVFGGGSKDSEILRFNISTLNTARDIQDPTWKPNSLLVVDECHRSASDQNARALTGPYLCTLGLSATPYRQYDDKLEKNVIPSIGPLIYTYTIADAEKDNILSPFELHNVEFSLLPHEQKEYDQLTQRIARLMSRKVADEEYLESLLRNRARVSSKAIMRVPLSVAIADRYRGARTIIFHEDITSANQIATLLSDRNHSVIQYHSKIGASTRRENLSLFRQGIFDVLVCCRALDEGINIPEVSVAIIAAATSSDRQRIQRLGRVLRPNPEKARATVISLFATSSERKRLAKEQKSLDGVADVVWKVANARDITPTV